MSSINFDKDHHTFPYRLQSCVWEITLACCFQCKYCGSKAGIARKDELTTEECLRVASELGKLGCKRVSLIGGEVFMRSDWSEIVRALIDQGISTAIITNGYLFTKPILDKLLANSIESVAVSLDGTQDLHDKYRQTGSFSRAICAIQELRRSGIPTSVITTLNNENVHVLERLYKILEATGIFAWQLQACSPMGNATASSIDFRFDFRDAIHFIERHIGSAPFMIGIADNIGYYTKSEGSLRGNLSGKAVFAGCKAGISSIGIDSIGNVRGCESMYDGRFIEGNLRDTTLREIWESPNSFRYNRSFRPDLLTGACHTCDHGAYCAGGCRSYNYFVHGRLYESPWCAKGGM